MKLFLVCSTIVMIISVNAFSSAVTDSPGRGFAELFTGETMRVDSFHSGTSGEEHFSIDRIVVEGAWAGRKTRLVDDLNLGKYRFQVRDLSSGTTLYSNGYCSIFGEWETTGEASDGTWKTFQEPFIFPEPRRPFFLVVEKRLRNGTFREIWSTEIDPQSRFVERSPVEGGLNLWTLFQNGPTSQKVDLLIMGDGYTSAEMEKFHSDAEELTEVLFSAAPFEDRKSDFNVRALDVVSRDSGISDPRRGCWKKTSLGLTFNALDLDRYVLAFDEKKIRDTAAAAPYDFLLLLFNDAKYGGGGIYNLWLTCSSDAPRAPYVFVHEFGHLFAGLADEYYSSDVAYENFESESQEPWEPNVTALSNPKELKWGHLVEDDTPIPTPWTKNEYDKLSSNRENLTRDEKNRQLLNLVKSDSYTGKVGAFEGAAYRSTGLYRPELACTMFSTQDGTGFCQVCREAIERVIDLHTGK